VDKLTDQDLGAIKGVLNSLDVVLGVNIPPKFLATLNQVLSEFDAARAECVMLKTAYDAAVCACAALETERDDLRNKERRDVPDEDKEVFATGCSALLALDKMRARAEIAERERDVWARMIDGDRAERDAARAEVTSIADVLKLEIPTGYDRCAAITADVRRLLEVEQRWTQACEIAREHCPVDVGESHIRQGIPALAKRHAAARAEIVILQGVVNDLADSRVWSDNESAVWYVNGKHDSTTLVKAYRAAGNEEAALVVERAWKAKT
jgi:hypothetical protein